MNMYLSKKETESIINNLIEQRAPSPHGVKDELYQTFKE